MRVKINTTSTGAYRFGYKRGPSDTSFVPKKKKKKRTAEKGTEGRRVPRERRSLLLIASRHRARGFRHILGIPKQLSLALLLSPERCGRGQERGTLIREINDLTIFPNELRECHFKSLILSRAMIIIHNYFLNLISFSNRNFTHEHCLEKITRHNLRTQRA